MIVKYKKLFFPIRFYLAVTVFVFIFLLLGIFSKRSDNSNTVKQRNDLKYILYWTAVWNHTGFGMGFGSEIYKHCPVNNCYATNNRSLIPVEDFDAVFFHGAEYRESVENKPSKRNPKQIYIYDNLESPFGTPRDLKFSPGFFNWTLSYRTDADIVRLYGVIKEKSVPYKLATTEDIQKRSRKIAWFSSHCGASSKRDMLAAKLNQYMTVDIYGACGKYECPKEHSNECYNMLEENYKFYLSFENAICVDYVTEKLFNVLNKNIVPIVYGGVNYDVIAPPHSVIDVTKFETVEELADHLKFLDEHPEEYLKYFEWKKDYYSDTSHESTLCELCQKLNEPRKTGIYDDILAWFDPPEFCKSGENLPAIVFS